MPTTVQAMARIWRLARHVFVALFLVSSLGRAAAPSLVQDFGSAAVNGPGVSATVTLSLSGLSASPSMSIGGVDFTAAPLYCSTDITVCSATVLFLPLFPGLKQDAIILADAFGNVVASAFLHGVGTGPALRAFPAAISTLAGNGSWSYVDGPAASASFRNPQGLAVDLQGNVYVADSINQVIRKIAAGTGVVSTIAGNGIPGYSGDGGPALSASLNTPTGVAVDSAGNLFVADQQNGLIRRVDAASEIITTVAGGGGNTANGVVATTAALLGPHAVTVDTAGNLYVADSFHNIVREITAATGLINTIAGGGTAYGSDGIGDGGPATAAQLNDPTGIALDASGNLFVADTDHSMIRRVDATTGNISVVAGNGSNGSAGDGGLASNAELGSPTGIRVDAIGNLYIADFAEHKVRFVNSQTGIISTLAGNGTPAYSGDGGVSTSASLNSPADLALDAKGDLLIADYANNVVRNVTFQSPTLIFPSTNVSLTSALVDVQLSNFGNTSLTFSALAISSPFQQVSSGGPDCSATLSLVAGGSCAIDINFVPTSVGAVTGTLQVESNSDNQSSLGLIINLAGTGLSGVPVATLSAASLTFSSQSVGTISSAQVVTLNNTGTAALSAINISVAGLNPLDFPISSTCAVTLAADATCTITVTFQPSLAGARSASLNFFDTAANAPQSVILTGAGTGGALAAISPAILQFGLQVVATASYTQNVTLTNSGAASMSIYGVSIAGVNSSDFTLVNTTCTTTLAASASCTISLNFIPLAAGARGATLTVYNSAGNSPQSVAFAGTGIVLAIPRLSATILQFGSQPIASAAPPQVVTLTNTGTASLDLAAVSIGGANDADFSIYGSTCGDDLASLSSCSVTISFVATGLGLRTANLVFSYSAENPQIVTLSGTGANPNPGGGNATADGIYDDGDPRVSYTGTWATGTNTPGRYMGTQSYSNQAGSTASLTFTGTAVAYVYETQSNLGQAQVSIDGTIVSALIDEYSPIPQAQARAVYAGLSDGTHTITVVALGTADSGVSSTYVIVDAFIVGALVSVYDDADPEIQYVGTWGRNTAFGRYLGTQTYSHEAGDSASFTFTGTQVTYVFETQGNFGHAQVSIDGNVVSADVDEYSAILAPQQKLVYSGLTDGVHTIVVTVLGTYDAAAADAYVVVDAFVTLQAQAGIYDDSHPLMSYLGTWANNAVLGRYNYTQSFSNQAQSTAGFTFTGTQVAYVYETQSNLGHVQVSIDGIIVSADIDEYSATRQFQQRIVYSGLSNGPHSIMLTVLGTQDDASTDAYVVLDAFIVGSPASTYDDWDPEVIHAGNWQQNAPVGRYDGTQSYSNLAGSSVSLTFEGSQVTYVFATQSNLGHAQVLIDGTVVTADLDQYSPTVQAQQQLVYSGLGSGPHTITVSVLGTSDAASSGAYVVVDAFITAP